MRMFSRIFLAVGLGLLGLVVIGSGVYLWLRSSLPVTSGTLSLPGPGAPIDITRDSRGIPYIRASSPADAYFALGFVHAQDRMWQMEMARRLAKGRLAEIGGERFLPQDKAMRTLGLHGLAETNLALLAPETRVAIAAYAAGVNAWIRSHEGALPPEFILAGIAPEPWKPVDSLLWGRLMGMRLSGNWRSEALRARLLEIMEPDRVEALWPAYPDDGPVTVPAPPVDRGARPGSGLPRHAMRRFPSTLLTDALPGPDGSASNSWAVAGTRTASGMPILAGDPHLRFRAPNLWYLARLDAPGLTVAGATLPGVPFHILGHNGAIAWTLTTTGADTQDLVIETPAPDDPAGYLAPGGTREFAVRTETIPVRGGPSVTHRVRATRNGPVISDLDGAARAPAGAGDAVVALRAAALAPDDRTADALYRLNRARDWREFRAALALFHSPVQNFVYADRAGHIGFQLAGRIPIRKHGDGFAPVPGKSADHQWTGYIPFGDLPRLLDPESGTVVNANNRVVGPGYPHLIARDWDKPYRAQRIVELLAATERHDLATSRAMQLDTLSLAAREIVPLLLDSTAPSGRSAEALRLLESWDGQVLRSHPEPLIFNAWLREATAAIVADDLGPLFPAYRRADPRFLRHVLTGEREWCDDAATAPAETCGAVLSAALERALHGLSRRFGPDISAWRWGDAHVARFRHPTLGVLPLIGRTADIAIATDGDDHTISRGTTRLSSRRSPFAHVHGATLRAIYDLSDLDRSLFMQPTGQSGNPLSPHYRDLNRAWRDGRYVTMPALPAGEVQRLRILPAAP